MAWPDARIRANLLVLTLLLGGAAACAGETAAPQSATRAVTAANGTVAVPDEPERVVVLWRPSLAAVVQLGFEPVGTIGDAGAADSGLAPYVGSYVAADSIELVGGPSGEDLSVEKVASLDPDLILGVSTANGVHTELEPELSAIAPTVLLDWQGTGSWRTHVTEVADVLGVPDRAREIVAEYDARVDEVREAVGPDPASTTVSVIRVQSPDELRFETPSSFPGQILDDLGFARPDAQLTPDEGKDYLSVSPERLDEGDADLVIVLPGGDNPDPTTNPLADNPLWTQLSAVQAGRTLVGDYAFWGSATYIGAMRILDDLELA